MERVPIDPGAGRVRGRHRRGGGTAMDGCQALLAPQTPAGGISDG